MCYVRQPSTTTSDTNNVTGNHLANCDSPSQCCLWKGIHSCTYFISNTPLINKIIEDQPVIICDTVYHVLSRHALLLSTGKGYTGLKETLPPVRSVWTVLIHPEHPLFIVLTETVQQLLVTITPMHPPPPRCRQTTTKTNTQNVFIQTTKLYWSGLVSSHFKWSLT